MSRGISTARRALVALRSERGDSDPILVIVSMAVSAIIASAIIGVLALVITVGTNFVTEQVQTSTLSSAQKSWSQDANNASDVIVYSDSQAVFYERQDRSPGVKFDRGSANDGDVAPVEGCRKSTWTASGSTITNVVEKWDDFDCDLDGNTAVMVTPASALDASSCYKLTGKTDKAVACTAITDVTGVVEIAAVNAAGRELVFAVDGTEVGSLAKPASAGWFTDLEWASPAPQKINLVSEVELALSGAVDGTLAGTTWISTTAPTDLNCENCPVEEAPAPNPHDPGELGTPTVTRSSSLGAMPTGEGSSHEGLNITFTGVQCGIYSTEYTVLIQPDAKSLAAGAKEREATWTSFEPVQSRDIDQVHNGTRGQVRVMASCPSSVAVDPIAPVTAPYTQSLPAPVITGAAAVAGAPHRHQLVWMPSTTLTAVYTVAVDVAGSGTTTAPVPAGPGTTQTVVWPEGSTFGQEYEYEVTAEVTTTGALSNRSAPVPPIFTPWPAVDVPGMNGTPVEPLKYQVTVDGVSCPTGTAAEYRQRVQFNSNGWETWSVWAAPTSTVVHEFIQGRRGEFQAQARCTYTDQSTGLTRSSPVSQTKIGLDTNGDPGAEVSPPGQWIEPITTVPQPAVATPADLNTRVNPAPPAPVTFSGAAGCPVETHPQYRFRYSVDGGPTTPWTVYQRSTVSSATLAFGARLVHDVQARCASDWGTPPQALGPDNTPASAVWVRQIPAPDPVTNVRSDQGGTSEPINNRLLWDAAACWDGTTISYDTELYGVGRSGWQAGLTLNVNTTWGKLYQYQVIDRCSSAHTVSPEAGTGYVPGGTWITNVPTPDTPVVSISRSSASTNQSFTVSVLGSTCPAGTSTGYDVWNSRSGTRWGAQAFNDSWPRNGSAAAASWFVTYYAQIWCAGPDAAGARSGTANAGITINQPVIPAPTSPVVSQIGGAIRYCDGAGWSFSVDWSPSANATSYTIGWRYQDGNGVSQVQPAQSVGNATAFSQMGSGILVNTVYVTAYGPGGISPTTTFNLTQAGGCSQI